MKVLCVHQNFPGQYLHLARHLGEQPGNEVVFLTQRQQASLPGVRKIVYAPARKSSGELHHYLREAEKHVLNAQAVARAALALKKEGFVPDVMLAHNGWGELWYLKDVFPDTPLIGYFEFFYKRYGADVGFDPQEQVSFDAAPRLRTKNLGNLIGLEAADLCQCPTEWQKSLYPEIFHPKFHVMHEGVDTAIVRPNRNAQITIPGTDLRLGAGDEVVTYVARNLEPYRGFPTFMRSLPAVLAARPNAQVVIVGGDETSYGPAPGGQETFRDKMLKELGDSLDLRRVHFLGKVPYPVYLSILQISSVHVYLTSPFVLSWSMLEAMAAGCLVVGSRTAPVQEVIRDGENGLLVDFFSPSDVSAKVIDALKFHADFHTVREAARRTVVESYDLAAVCLPRQLAMLDLAMKR